SCRSDYSCSAACDGPGCPTRGTVWFEAPGSAARRAEPVKQLHGSVQYYGLIHSRAGESCLSVVTTHAAAIPARLTSHLPAPHASALLPQPGSANRRRRCVLQPAGASVRLRRTATACHGYLAGNGAGLHDQHSLREQCCS